MARVARSIEEFYGPVPNRKRHPIVGFDHSRGVNRNQLTVIARGDLITINGADAGHQFARIDQMTRTARMNDKLCIRQLLEESARSSCMIEMNMRDDQIVYRITTDTCQINRIEKPRHGAIRSRINESAASIVAHDEIRRVETRPHEAGVNLYDSVIE